MVELGIWMIINLFDLFIYRKYLEVFVGRRKTSTEFSICLLFACALAGSLANYQNSNALNLVACFLVLIIYSLQYKVSLQTRMAAVFIFLGIIFVTEPVGYLIHMILIEEKIHDHQISFFILAFIFEIIRMILVETFCFLKQGKEISVSKIPKEVLYILYIIPLTSIVSCILIIEIAEKIVNQEMLFLCMTIIFTIIISNYLMFSMVHRYVELTERRREADLLYQESILKEEYYRDMEESIEQIHTLKHDMKNQLMGLYDLVTEEQSQEVKEKLKSMVADVTELEDKVYSMNPVINAVLKIKIAKAEAEKITVEAMTLVPKRMNIEIGDYGVLYGNLLDNAIEACMKVNPSERYIRVRSKYQAGTLMLEIKNSKENISNPGLKTTKQDKRMHGRGIQSVRKASEKYGGVLVLKDHGTAFETNLMLTGIEALE